MLKQERAVITRKQIIQGAAEMFDRVGYERASLAEIVALSGITKGALYFHFRSKDDLAGVVIEEQHAISMNAVVAIGGTGAPALEQLVMLCYEMGRSIVEDPVVRAGIRLTLEMSAVGGPQRPYLDWIDSCERLARDAVAQGDVVDTVVPAQLGRFIVSAFTGVQIVSNVLTARTDLYDCIDQMLTLLLPGIVPPDRRSGIDRTLAARWTPAAD
ncbi:ScbR family autoregulator-binding transcription factor [Rhodococcus sp. TAF43]|uniref:ScbR family autoregulator-binding transcription factor n=1 Tax=unclassified Rhodococcus (in: high G+C Gram-positive bacteria) TaxID=192944 RepID=UPI0015821ADB|nr:ScbR family autoregulator-binding transcription factor [Rhodococcus sp. W8901]QKT10009.1 TetR/AcrR family transcriptional regulator [Rhodococcus sp. W8901]